MSGGDNREDAPARLFGVAEQQGWEREVGRTLAARAATVRPSRDDLATAAVARARRTQRRRRAISLAGVGLATALVIGALLLGLSETGTSGGSIAGLFSDVDGGEEEQEPSVTDQEETTREVRLAADEALVERAPDGIIGDGVADGLVLATPEGVLADLGPIRNVASAHRLTGGWAVVSGETGTARLWWITDDDQPRVVLSGMDAIVVEGTRVAWRQGSMLSAAVLTGAGDLEQRINTTAPDGDAQPVAFLDRAVLMRRTAADGVASWAIWRPFGDDCAPTRNRCRDDADLVWSTQQVTRVYGALPGGRTAVGLVPPQSGEEGICLARLRIDDSLEVARRACLPGLSATGAAALSPDGRWLVAATNGASSGGSVVVDVVAALAGDAAAVNEVEDVAAPASRPIWETSRQVVFPTADSLVWLWPERVNRDAPDAVDVVPLSGRPPTLIE